MQLLHTCPVPNVDFASLSLLIHSVTRSSSDSDSDSVSNEQHCPESFIELTVVNSPLAMTPPSVANQALNELHETLASQPSLEAKVGLNTRNKKVTQNPVQVLKQLIHPNIGDDDDDADDDNYVNGDDNVDVDVDVDVDGDGGDDDGSISSSNNFQNLCIEEDVAHLDNTVPQSFRPTRCRNGLLLNYIAIHDERIVQQCASIFSPSYNSRPYIEKPSQGSYLPHKYSLIICVGITGMPYSYGMSSIIHSLPRRLIEFVGMLSRLKTNVNLLQANKQRHDIETILTSIFMDDEYLRTNASVQAENGLTNITEQTKGTTVDGSIRKARSTKFFASGMSVVKMPKKISFAAERRRKKKHSKEKDDKSNFVPTALISSSLPSLDLSKIISSMYQILSLAEKDMTLRPYQARMKRQAEYNMSRRGKGDQKMYKSPSRLGRKLGRIDVGLSGADLPGFDFVSPRTKSECSTASSAAVHSLGSESTANTALTSLESASTASIPTLSGPSRDSSASKIQYRRNKVAAASAANQYSKSWASSIGKSPRTAQLGLRRTLATDDRKVRAKAANDGAGQEETHFDPFSLNGDFVASDAGSVATTSTEGKSNDDQRSGRSLTSAESNHSGTLSQHFATKRYRSINANANANPQDAKEGRSVSSPCKIEGRSLNAATLQNGATPGTKVIVNIAMNEDLSCSYCSSKLASCLIEGMIQAQIKSNSSAYTPFALTLSDTSDQIRTVVENKKYADDVSHELSTHNTNTNETNVHYKYAVTLPKVNHYYPIVKYKCNNDLRPVPIVSI